MSPVVKTNQSGNGILIEALFSQQVAVNIASVDIFY